MALSYRTLNQLPHMRNYEEASRVESRIIPIRGRKPEVKPIGDRKQTHHTVERHPDSAAITVMRGPTRLITYNHDNTVRLYGPRWGQKAAESEIMGELLGWDVLSEHNALWVRCRVEGGFTDGWLPIKAEKDGGCVFAVPEGRDLPVALTPNYPLTHVVNRKGANATRERYKAFAAYAKGMRKLLVEEHPSGSGKYYQQKLPEQPYGDAFGWHTPAWDGAVPQPVMITHPKNWNFNSTDADQLAALMRSSDPTSQYKAFLWMQPNRQLVGEEYLLDSIEHVIFKAHPHEVLKQKVHVDGKRRRDKYRWAVTV